MKKILLILLLISVSSCSLLENRKENIINKELTLIPSTPLPQEQKLPFIIIKADGRLAGSTGCNRIIGTAYFGKNPGEVIFKNISTTKMFCNQNDYIEEKFIEALNKTLHYTIEQNTVFLYDGERNPLIRLKIK